MTLPGLYFFHSRESRYSTGSILAAVEPSVYLLQYDARDPAVPPPPLEIVEVSEMLDVDDLEDKAWKFFKTREELTAWVAWLNMPEEESANEVEAQGRRLQ